MSERFAVDNSFERGFNKYMAKCFGVMALGLVITALMAFLSYSTGLWSLMYLNKITVFAFVILQLAVVIFFSSRLHKMSTSMAYVCFFVYSLITGYTLGSLGVVYDVTTMGIAFGLTAVLFVNLCIIGLTTKTDVTKYGTLLFVGLFTLLIASIIGIFLNLPVLDMVVCYVGIGIFLCLIAYDVQMMRKRYEMYQEGELLSKMMIDSAFNLYLDFINIFLYILRLLGRRK